MIRFCVIMHSENMHVLENDNIKRADFPKISESFRKIREQADIPKIFCKNDSLDHLLLKLQYE